MVRKTFFVFLFIFSISYSQSDTLLIFSEVMFYPTTGNNEFIEVYNLSSTQSVDLSSYKIKYYTTTSDQIVDAGSGTILLPESYAVIFENDYDIAAGIYNNTTPSSALILKIADNSFGSTGMANTTSRPLWLINSTEDTVDYYFYSANNNSSISDEKIILNHNSLETNWTNTLVSNGTPGFTNSVTPTNYDLQLSSITIVPTVPIAGNDVTINIKIKNNGILIANNYSLEVFNDIDKDSIADLNERIFLQSYNNLSPTDSIIASINLDSLTANNYQIIAQINFPEDQNLTNNIFIKQFTVNPPGNSHNDIVINEIMYAPSTSEPEWIEIYNRSAEAISLKNWKLSDASTTITISNSDILIKPNSFLVISHDSSILNYYNVASEIIVTSTPLLNNTGDIIVIKDFNESIIDSVSYLPTWGGSTNGKSLERISADEDSNDPTNWGTSKSIYKATPGTFNSVTQKDFDLLAENIEFNPEFPLIGDNINLAAKIKNAGKNTATFSIDLFEDTNLDSIPDIFIESLLNLSLNIGDSSIYGFNYLISNLQNERSFFIKVSFDPDQDTTNNSFYKAIEPGFPSQTIIINEIMFAPIGGEPEWIELYNNSESEINLTDWTIWDVVTTPAKATVKDNLSIPANGFVVVTKDSAIINYHRQISSEFLELNLPSFNNDNDGVVIKDKRGLTIDSVFYSNQWGGTNGFSIERISSTSYSNNQFNWASSKDIEQSTPGRINSVTPKEFDLMISDISFLPRFPAIEDNVSITAKIKNNGSRIAQNFTTNFYIDTDSNEIVNLLLSSVTTSSLNPGDLILITSDEQILSLQNKILTGVKVIFSNDEDTSNNYYEKSIEPGFAQNIIKINEVMYNPYDGYPEWVEFVNVSNESINLQNWMISDVLTTPTKNFITNETSIIFPNEIFIVAKDTSFNYNNTNENAKVFYSNFGSLSNTADGIMLYDFRNAIIDSLFYHSDWGGKKGFSLERIDLSGVTNDSTNWITSLDISGSTPGKQNSIYNVPVYEFGSIVVNEIMYDPDVDFSEYIEFYNLNSDSINIGGWKVEDENGNFYKLMETSFLIPPKEYFILIADSSTITRFSLQDFNYKNTLNISSLGLINTGELILLKDAREKTIDSVFYNDSWNNKNLYSSKGKSLEKINPGLSGNDPLNWSTSVNSLGGTPGKRNSIFAENLNQTSNINVNPNPFSPDNDGFEDFTIINYNLTQPVAQVRIKIFDNKGRLVRTLLNNQPSGSGGSIVFDGLDDNGKALRMGIYIIFLEALNENSGVTEVVKAVVVVARKL